MKKYIISILNTKDANQEIISLPRVERKIIPLGSGLADYLSDTLYCNPNISSDPKSDTADSLQPNIEENLSVEEIVARVKAAHKKATLVDARELRFKNLLCSYYKKCSQDPSLYKEDIFRMFFAQEMFQVPYFNIVPIFDSDEIYSPLLISEKVNIEKLIDSTKGLEYFLRQYPLEEINSIDYFLAIALELVQRKYTMNTCLNCGKWFVSYNKSDAKYCDRKDSKPFPEKTCRDSIKCMQTQCSNINKQIVDMLNKREEAHSCLNDRPGTNFWRDERDKEKERLKNKIGGQFEYMKFLKRRKKELQGKKPKGGKK